MLELKKESVQRMICQFRKNPSDIVVCSDGEKRGNPAIFPSDLFGELYQLTGDQGGRRVMVQHEELLILLSHCPHRQQQCM